MNGWVDLPFKIFLRSEHQYAIDLTIIYQNEWASVISRTVLCIEYQVCTCCRQWWSIFHFMSLKTTLNTLQWNSGGSLLNRQLTQRAVVTTSSCTTRVRSQLCVLMRSEK